MKRDRELENIFDECLEKLLTGGQTVEQCLGDYPERADELRPLLETALVASQARDIRPRAEFKAQARYQFQAALNETRPKRGFFAIHWPRWANVVAVALVLLLAGGSTVMAAEESQPDGALYPVKLASEQVRLAFTFSDIGKATLYANLTDRRVNEMDGMVRSNRPELVAKTAERLNENLEAVAILTGGDSDGNALMLAPGPEAAKAPEFSPAPLPAGESDRNAGAAIQNEKLARLRMLIARYAERHPEKLRAMLETAPESAKPALQQALAIAEARYQQALEAIDRGWRERQ